MDSLDAHTDALLHITSLSTGEIISTSADNSIRFGREGKGREGLCFVIYYFNSLTLSLLFSPSLLSKNLGSCMGN